MLKSDVTWSSDWTYMSKTEWEPVGFFSEGLCNATSFDLMLGFFSSSAINVLSDGFAAFLQAGGRMRLIINDILSNADKNAIANGLSDGKLSHFDLSDLSALKKTLSSRDRHFFECLSWLIRKERIDIKIVAPADTSGIAHTKCGVFSDGLNRVAFQGSVNFSYAALVQNIESLNISCDWNGQADVARISHIMRIFDKTFSGDNPAVKFVDIGDVKTNICNAFQCKELEELLVDEMAQLNGIEEDYLPPTVAKSLLNAKNRVATAIERNKKRLVATQNEPHFPYSSGPRAYQAEAFECWKANNQKGLFAMATGTGKTITSLNCLFEVYKRFRFYKAIILVPTLTLVDQWEEECKKFNFNNIVKVCSKNKNWDSELDTIKIKEEFDSEKNSFIIIATYASFAREKIFGKLVDFNRMSMKRILLIADEAHNMGSGRILDRLGGVKFLRRIGLSATPERQFDDETNATLMDFFGCRSGYTYVFSMKEAIDKGFLCRYRYYPHVVRLTDEEMSEYLAISAQLAKFFNYDKERFPQSGDILLNLLLKRKRIVHKACNKERVFRQIVQDRFNEKGNLRYTLVYVPEGNRPDSNTADLFDTTESVGNDDYTDHLIDTYTQIVQEVSPVTTVKKFVSGIQERNHILNDFAKGNLEVLTSMKCLDEGVDVPRSELAIFCASTGNPRQFIQRRGRILRTHPDKHEAIIHDLVVVPEISSVADSFKMERSLLSSELRRVRDFAVLSENADFAYNELDNVLSYYNLSLF